MPESTIYDFGLIHDRTQNDVKTGTAKGFYNADDLNRVESAVAYLAAFLQSSYSDLKDYAENLFVAWDQFFALPYDPDDYNLETKTDWDAINNWPTASDMVRYLNNIIKLREAIPVNYPVLPESMIRLTFTGANAIESSMEMLYEALLAEIEQLKIIIDLAAGFHIYSGEFYAGEIGADVNAG